jgi:hypothetical protein
MQWTQSVSEKCHNKTLEQTKGLALPQKGKEEGEHTLLASRRIFISQLGLCHCS